MWEVAAGKTSKVEKFSTLRPSPSRRIVDVESPPLATKTFHHCVI